MGGVILERLTARHRVYHFEQASLRVTRYTVRRDHAVVPVISPDQPLAEKRVWRPCGDDRSVALRLHDRKRTLVATAQDLERLRATHEIVLHRIQREQDAHTTIEIGVQDDHVAVSERTREDPDAVSLLESAFIVEPDLDDRVRLGRHDVGRTCGEHQRDEQGDEHTASSLGQSIDASATLSNERSSRASSLIAGR
jgi:hypothetical protein